MLTHIGSVKAPHLLNFLLAARQQSHSYHGAPQVAHSSEYLRNLRRTWARIMGRPTAKVLRSRDHLTKLWQMRQKGEKGANQDRHCCDNSVCAHQKSHQPIVRDGKVGVSRLPEEDHHQCNDAACDSVSHHQCNDSACDSVFEKVLTDFPAISFIWIIHIKYRKTCSFRLNWNQKTNLICLIFLHLKKCAMEPNC